MRSTILISAVLTGVFWAVFARGVDRLTAMLDRGRVLALSLASGFLGSLFVSIVLMRGREN
jgi:hypothetical protein